MRIFIPLALLILAACTVNAPANTNTTPAFAGPGYRLNAGKVEVLNEYQAPQSAPNIDYRLTRKPSDDIRDWANQRFVVGGTENTVEVAIKNASIVQKELEKTKGIKGVFTKDPSQQFDGLLEIEIRLYTPGNLMSAASAQAQVKQSITVMEDATAEQRDAAIAGLQKQMIERLDQEMRVLLPQYFSTYLLP